MDRRRFLEAVVAGGGAALLAGCSNEAEEATMGSTDLPESMSLGSLRSSFTQVKDLRMHALISVEPAPANAPAMVLVHGSGLSGRYMIPTARELTSDFRVYVPDIPGYGDSGDPGEILDVPGMADWLAAWMAAVELPRAAFLGNSFGCQVIADLAARHPALVAQAVLQGPTTPPDERSAFWQFVRWRQNQAYNPEWLGAVTNIDYHKAGLLRLIRSFMVQITDRIEDKMPRIEASVLVVRGAEDPIAHQAFCEMLVRRCRRGELQVIPGVAHTLVVTAPVQLAQATREFIRRTSP